MLIKGALSKKIIQKTGLGHAYSVKRHIEMAAEKKLISHDEARTLKKEYDRLNLGKPIPKHEVKELLTKLQDKRLNIPGTYLRTIAANPEKVISRAEHLVHAEERDRIIAQNKQQNLELEKTDEEAEKKKKEQEEKDRSAEEKIVSADHYQSQKIAEQHQGKTALPHTMKAA